MASPEVTNNWKGCNMKFTLYMLFVLMVGAVAQASGEKEKIVSRYAGEETRDIKSLSKEDIRQLKTGSGWGLAKAAELNGFPGPSHVLTMKEDLKLNESQQLAMDTLYLTMKAQAIEKGGDLIELEKELDLLFQKGLVSLDSLLSLLSKIGEARTELRFVHLASHLRTMTILSEKQVQKYNKLQGYVSRKLCGNTPKFHHNEMSPSPDECS